MLLVATILWACAPAAELLSRSEPPPPAEKRIAFSFDDAPRATGPFLDDDRRTALLIDNLREAGVEQAAFFINPGQIADQPGAEQRIAAYVAAGHVIANHTATHPSLSDLSVAEYVADIDRAEDWLRGREGYRPWFRYPFLNEGRRDAEKRDAIRAALAQRGLRNGYVTVDASDWFYENAARVALREGRVVDREALRDLYVEAHVDAAEFYDRLAHQALRRAPAHVMLLHETDIAALWIDDLIAALRARGWTIVSADEAYRDPLADLAANYATPSAQGTLTEMVAWQNGLPAPRWYRGNDVEVAQRWFDTRVLGLPTEPGD